jgi:hypothetical protein
MNTVIEMTARTGKGVETRRMYTDWEAARQFGRDRANEFFQEYLGESPLLMDRTDESIPARQFWAADESGESPSIEMLELSVYAGADA